MKIIYHDLCIRNAESADCPQLARWWNDGSVMAHAGFPRGLGTTAEEIQEQIEKDSDDARRRLMIEYKGAAIGEMSYYNRGDQVAEIGIKICDTDHQEKGLGKVILSLFIEELFSMGYVKIILDTNLRNTRAQHVYETLGFHKVRINEDSWTNQVGEIQSSVDYELVRDDFVDYAAQTATEKEL